MKNPIGNLNKIFDSRIRMGVMSALSVNDEMNFNDLKQLLELTDGNLASHLSNLVSLPSLFWSIGPSLLNTAFDAGRRRALERQAQANYDAAVGTYRQSVLTAIQQAEDNLAALRILAEEAAQQDIAIVSGQRVLDLAFRRYRGGITTYLEVITAQNTLLGIQRTAVDIRTRRMSASVLLIKALGGTWNVTDLPSAKSLK